METVIEISAVPEPGYSKNRDTAQYDGETDFQPPYIIGNQAQSDHPSIKHMIRHEEKVYTKRNK